MIPGIAVASYRTGVDQGDVDEVTAPAMIIVTQLAALLLSLGAPTATPAASVDSWQGIRPGESVADVLASAGKPLLQRRMPDGEILTWNGLVNQDAYMILLESGGAVRSIRVFATTPSGSRQGLTDRFGVAIGDSPDRLLAMRGSPKKTYSDEPGETVSVYDGSDDDDWVYEFDDNQLHAIMLMTKQAPPANESVGPDPNDGSTIEKAFVITADSEFDGIRFERYYASNLSGCTDGWKIGFQSVSSRDKREFDKLDLTCSADNSQRSVFFDITSFFGKL